MKFEIHDFQVRWKRSVDCSQKWNYWQSEIVCCDVDRKYCEIWFRRCNYEIVLSYMTKYRYFIGLS